MSSMFAAVFRTAEDSEAVAEAPNPIIPEWNEVIWGSLAFFILLIVMWKFAYPAIRKAMEQRTERIQGDIDAAQAARTEAEQKAAEYDQLLADANAERVRIIDEARAEAEQVRQQRLDQIEPEIAERRAQAEADIAAARERALADVRAEITQLAVRAAEQVVGASLDDDRYTALVNDYIDNVGRDES